MLSLLNATAVHHLHAHSPAYTSFTPPDVETLRALSIVKTFSAFLTCIPPAALFPRRKAHTEQRSKGGISGSLPSSSTLHVTPSHTPFLAYMNAARRSFLPLVTLDRYNILFLLRDLDCFVS